MRVFPTMLALALIPVLPAMATAQDTTMAMADSQVAPVLEESAVLAIFDGANRRDIETATIGIERSRDARVRQLAVRFANEHMALRRQGQQVGTQAGQVPLRSADSAAMRVHGEVVQWLKSVPADSFDVVFLEHEVAYHAAVLEAMNGLLIPAATTPEIQALLQAAAPAFEQHLQAARSLRDELTGMAPAMPTEPTDAVAPVPPAGEQPPVVTTEPQDEDLR